MRSSSRGCAPAPEPKLLARRDYCSGDLERQRLEHHWREGVIVERLPWEAFVQRYDTLFYVDAPYLGCEDDYGLSLFARSHSSGWASFQAPHPEPD